MALEEANPDLDGIGKGPGRHASAVGSVRGRRPAPFELTDLGNAARFAAQHGQDLLYCPDWRAWLVWDRMRWVREHRGEVQELAKATIREISEEASGVRGPARKRLLEHARASQSAHRIAAMITLAQSELAVTPGDLDANPWLLNTPAGTVDLRTGECQPHNRLDRITKLTAAAYDPEALCPRWEAFLREAVGDDDTILYLQRAAGYAASGSTRERVIIVVLGPTATGKTTLLEVLRGALGDYALVTPMSTLLGGQRSASIPADIAALAGARLVIASEADDSGVWDAAKVKLLTGGDTLTARHLYGHYFSFTPTHTLMLATNRLPATRADAALLDRLHLIPFTTPHPGRARNLNLRAELEAELPGILAWIVRGAVVWQRDGLHPTPAMRHALARYEEDSDPVGAWLRERTDLSDRRAETRVRDAYESYLAWCAAADETPVTERAFGARLTDAGLARRRATHGERRWVGLCLVGDTGDASDASYLFDPEQDPDLRSITATHPGSVTSVTRVPPTATARAA